MKTLTIAKREFLSTVMTTGFVIGVLIFPVIMVGVIAVIPKLLSDDAPKVVGDVLVLDKSSWDGTDEAPTMLNALTAAYTPEALARESEAFRNALEAQVGADELPAMQKAAVKEALKQLEGELPEITVKLLDESEDLEESKQKLFEGSAQTGGLLAIVVIDENAVTPEPAEQAESPTNGDTQTPELPNAPPTFGAYELLLRPNLDDRIESALHSKVKDAIRNARFANAGEDLLTAQLLMTVQQGAATVVTETGEAKSTGGAANIFLAIGFMMLIYASVMTGGQYLMMTVIEEKSSRVMEVLLSAASPMQLMTGKIVGQLGVALLVVGIYMGIGLVGLSQFNMLYLVSGGQIGLIAIYFFLAFFMMATLMAAVGSAVTEIREAQSYMTAVMLLMILPWLLFMPLVRNPNSLFATISGLVPPISPFAMAIRLAAAEPIPQWQIITSIFVGLITCIAFIWLTSKIFRVGVLMYGKPPNLPTLIKWIRMA